MGLTPCGIDGSSTHQVLQSLLVQHPIPEDKRSHDDVAGSGIEVVGGVVGVDASADVEASRECGCCSHRCVPADRQRRTCSGAGFRQRALIQRGGKGEGRKVCRWQGAEHHGCLKPGQPRNTHVVGSMNSGVAAERHMTASL